MLATWAREKTGAQVDIVDLVCEALGGQIALDKLLDGPDGNGYDVIAFSVYSSFDHLKCHAIAEVARERWPEAVIVAGGYHASARPDHFVYDGSPFDVCVVGEGEYPLIKIIESVKGGAPLRNEILGSDAVEDLSVLPPTDWSYLEKYRPVARRMASQAQVYLSRGCPFDCAFCMERAKREVSWRPLPVERALEEMMLLHEFLDLRGWTLYIADALFGMKKSWRRSFLEGLARMDLPAEKLWLLIRVDLVEDEDLKLFDGANCGLGFGLESGDEDLLAAIRKAGRLDTYLQRMMEVAAWARERNVPWGANIICGHPGETPSTMERSAAYMRELFLDKRGTTGFLSVDPFRLYPGSPIDGTRPHYEQTYGTRFYRPEWWNDGDPEFLSEWVDPSSELSWLERERLQNELLAPVLAEIEGNFVYSGKARNYFLRAVQEQVKFSGPAHRMHYIDRYYAWQKYLGFGSRAEEERRHHQALRDLARTRRKRWLSTVAKRAQLAADSPIMQAIDEVPRERFVPLDELKASARDEPIALDRTGDATVSAMHAYARTFSLLDVQVGDRVADLGAGSGYGSAILRQLVGAEGKVVAVELDPRLGRAVRADLEADGVEWLAADASDIQGWNHIRPNKVCLGYAVDAFPEEWLTTLEVGTKLVGPVKSGTKQVLTRATVTAEGYRLEPFDAVTYVRQRSEADLPAIDEVKPARKREPKRLPVVAD